jgi:hypothetical protein
MRATSLALAASAAIALLGASGLQAQPRGFGQNAPPAGPAPRNDAGRVVLDGDNPRTVGVWTPLFGISDPVAPIETVPFQPWAAALYEDRQAHELEPHARCKASGVSRQFLTPYGVEIVEIPELERLYIFDIGGPHTFRTVYMDGRSHPADLQPTNYGHTIGWWEGDTRQVQDAARGSVELRARLLRKGLSRRPAGLSTSGDVNRLRRRNPLRAGGE